MRIIYQKQYKGHTESTNRLKSFCAKKQWKSIKKDILITQDEYVDIITELVSCGCNPIRALSLFTEVLKRSINSKLTYKEVVEFIMWGVLMFNKFE